MDHGEGNGLLHRNICEWYNKYVYIVHNVKTSWHPNLKTNDAVLDAVTF